MGLNYLRAIFYTNSNILPLSYSDIYNFFSDEVNLRIVLSILTLLSTISALIIAIFQENWRKFVNRPKVSIEDKLDFWETLDSNPVQKKKWYRLKVINKGRSTSHENIIKIMHIFIQQNDIKKEIFPEGFPFPKSLRWGSYEGDYRKDLRPNEFEYINLFFLVEKESSLNFPYQIGRDKYVTLDISKYLLNESFDTTFPKVKLIFEIYIFSDDLIRIPIYKIEFQIGLSEESTPTISNLKLIE